MLKRILLGSLMLLLTGILAYGQDSLPLHPPSVPPVMVDAVPTHPQLSRLPSIFLTPVPTPPPATPTATRQTTPEVAPDTIDAETIDAEAIGAGAIGADAVDVAEVIEDEALAVEPGFFNQVGIWEGGVELGLNGAEGNTKTFNIRFGVDAKLKTPSNIVSLDFDYHKTDSNYVETANRAYFNSRFEQLYEDSRWTSFVHSTLDYDEFKAFDSRWSADLGLGYQCIQSEPTSLAARFGAGVSQEVGGTDESIVPEAVFGLDFSHKLNDRQKLTAAVEYTPDMTGFQDFRLRTRATWEVLIDPEVNLSLKFSITDRYDSTPDGKLPNDLDYSAVLLWNF